jgi:hypothetical protein
MLCIICFKLNHQYILFILFNNWSKLGGTKHNHLVLISVVVLCWAIWLTINDIAFNMWTPNTFLQVLFRGTQWLKSWALLQRLDDYKECMLKACKALESRAMHFLAAKWLAFYFHVKPYSDVPACNKLNFCFKNIS